MPRNNRPGPRSARRAAATTSARAGAGRHGAPSPTWHRGVVRIIGGRWRGRKLHFPQSHGLRPTPDRVRETVFNWLQFELAGRRCLDLYSGSGALGIEALSRGASEVCFVEADGAAAAAIEATLREFAATGAHVVREDVFAFLQASPPVPYDVVFVDPPYAEQWLGPTCTILESGGWLAPGAWIYLEDAAERGAPSVPAPWALVRSKTAGDVGYHLARRSARPT